MSGCSLRYARILMLVTAAFLGVSLIQPQAEAATVTLTMSAPFPPDGGTTTPAAGPHTFDQGTGQTLVATPGADYAFYYWDGDVVDMYSATTSIIMNGDRTVTAHFRSKYSLNMMTQTPEIGGTVSPVPGVHSQSSAWEATLTASPAEDYEFEYWEGLPDDKKYTNPLTLMIDTPYDLKAHFKKVRFWVYVEYEKHPDIDTTCSITPVAGQYQKMLDEVINLDATVEDGWRFAGWKVTPAEATQPVDPNALSTTITVDQQKTINATFYKQMSMTIQKDLTGLGEGTINPSLGSHTYDYGQAVMLTATANADSAFDHWTINGMTYTENPLEVSMVDNKDVSVTFSSGYTLTVLAVGNGQVDPPVGAYQYKADTEIPLTAIPSVGWRFTHWEGAVTGEENPISLILNQEMSVTANFEQMYTLESLVAPTDAGSVTRDIEPNVDGYYQKDTVVTLTANTNTGFRFLRWEGAVSSMDPVIQVPLTQDSLVRAWYARVYPLTVTISPSTRGTVQVLPAPGPEGKYLDGEEVTLSAEPVSGYSFSHWSGAATGNSNPKTVSITGATSITANFVKMTQVTTQVSPEGAGTITANPLPDSQGRYPVGTLVSFTAVANPGYSFANWAGNASGTNATTSLTVGNSSLTVEAQFAQLYTLSLNVTPSASGTISASPQPNEDGFYAPNTEVTLTAAPASNYTFGAWSGAVTSTNPTTTVIMSSNRTVTGTFLRLYSLTTQVSPTGGGTVNASPAPSVNGKYVQDTNVTLTAIPTSGYAFTGWSGAATGTTNPLIVKMTGDKTVTANFIRMYTLTVGKTPSNGGTVTANPAGDGQGNYTPNTLVTLTAIPAQGYVLESWSGDASGESLQVVVNMNANRSVQANFKKAYSLSVSLNDESAGEINVSPAPRNDGLYLEGTVVTIDAVANLGYRFTEWSGGQSGTDSTVEITMASDLNITGNFRKLYMVSVNITPANAGTVTRDVQPDEHGYYEPNTFVTLRATAAAHNTFLNWTGDAVGVRSETKVYLNSDKVVTANFAPTYPLTLGREPEAGGTITANPLPSVGGEYPADTLVTVTAQAASGYRFAGWLDDATGTATSTAIRMDSARTVTASFMKVYPFATLITGQGQILTNPAPINATYDDGQEVTFSAQPSEGWVFDHWEGISATTNPATVPIVSALNLRAVFKQLFTLAVSITPEEAGGVQISPPSEDSRYVQGTQVTLLAAPLQGYVFNRWEGGASGTQTTLAVNMNSDLTITAVFVAESTEGQVEGQPLEGEVPLEGELEPVEARFTASPVRGSAPLTVQFTDHSSGGSSAITAWSWDFDGVPSTEANPSYEFTEPGLYSVSLTVTSASGTDTYEIQNLVYVRDGDSCVSISSPLAGSVIYLNQNATGLTLPFAVETTCAGVARVEYHLDGNMVGEVTESPFTLQYPNLEGLQRGFHTATAEAFDGNGDSLALDDTVFVLRNSSSTQDADGNGMPDNPFDILQRSGDRWFAQTGEDENVINTLLHRIDGTDAKATNVSDAVLPMPTGGNVTLTTGAGTLPSGEALLLTARTAVTPASLVTGQGPTALPDGLTVVGAASYVVVGAVVSSDGGLTEQVVDNAAFAQTPVDIAVENLNISAPTACSLYSYPVQLVAAANDYSFECAGGDVWSTDDIETTGCSTNAIWGTLATSMMFVPLEEIPPVEGQPVEGQPQEGQIEGQPAEGQPVEGQPEEGQPADGEPAEGQPAEGQPAEGEVIEGETLEGEVVEGQLIEGETPEGAPIEGEPQEGEIIEGQAVEGQSVKSVFASFSATPLAGPAPLAVQFTDTSYAVNDTITSWYWLFGDGTTSEEQNPAHTYTRSGIYTVSLTVRTLSGESNKSVRESFITASSATVEGQDAGTDGEPQEGQAAISASGCFAAGN